jgi:hypothetical protein
MSTKVVAFGTILLSKVNTPFFNALVHTHVFCLSLSSPTTAALLFGSWKLRAIAARTVKSIRTGKDVSLPAHKRVGFSAGTTLSQAAEAPKGASKTAAKKR